jgi:hypothetical protein
VLTTTRPRRLTRPSPAGHIKYANTPGAPNSRDGTVRPLAAHDDQPCPRRRRHRTASRPPQAHDLGRKNRVTNIQRIRGADVVYSGGRPYRWQRYRELVAGPRGRRTMACTEPPCARTGRSRPRPPV